MAEDKTQPLQQQVLNAIADKTPLQIKGGNSKAFYGRKTDADEVLDITTHTGIVNYEPSELVVTVRTGTRLTDLETILGEKSQQLPFEPPIFHQNATVGGMIAAGISGPRRAYAGAIRDALLGVKIINGKGEILQFGGQVMKNVAGYDVSRLMAGAMGTLGVLLEVSIKLNPIPAKEITLQFSCSAEEALQKMTQWRSQANSITATAYHDDQLYVRLSGGHSSVEANAATLGGDRLDDGTNWWRFIRHQQHSFFTPTIPLWRLSVPPATAPLGLAEQQFIEWSGAQRWLFSDAPAETIRKVVAAVGGHATLFRSNTPIASPFHPLTTAHLRIHQRLKQSLDPHGIFNPGRMYSEL